MRVGTWLWKRFDSTCIHNSTDTVIFIKINEIRTPSSVNAKINTTTIVARFDEFRRPFSVLGKRLNKMFLCF